MIYCSSCRYRCWFEQYSDLAFCINPDCPKYTHWAREKAIKQTKALAQLSGISFEVLFDFSVKSAVD